MREDERRPSVRRKKMQAHESVEKSRNTVFFQCLELQAWVSKSKLAKGAGAEPSGQMRDQTLHAAVALGRTSRSQM